MKRPEGFDPPGSTPDPRPAARKPRAPVQDSRVTLTPAAKPGRPSRADIPGKPARTAAPVQQRRARDGQPRPDAAARSALRAAARERRRVERAEVRRFTRRARNRRVTIVVAAGLVLTLVGLVLTAVYSPILALRHVTVDGTSRVDATELTKAVSGQLGTPLALIDYDSITEQLGAFPLIRSYITELVPPDTLLIHVTERQPVGSIPVGAGYALVDPAGVTVQESVERIPGVPLIELGGAGTDSPSFRSMVDVLLALPPELLAQVDSISAHTQDDVTLVLTGVGQRVRWGAAEESDRKARLLAALIGQTDPAAAGIFDVSAPSNGVFRPS